MAGYGYTKPGYGYNSVYAPAHHVGGHHLGGVAHHGVGHAVGHLGVAHHGVGHGVSHAVGHGVGHAVGHHGVAHHGVAAGYGAGYGAPQPFVGSGFRYQDSFKRKLQSFTLNFLDMDMVMAMDTATSAITKLLTVCDDKID